MVRQYMPVGENKQNLDQASNLVKYWDYLRDISESEAREAENRMDRSAEWRAENPPSWDGIPVDKLTVGGCGAVFGDLTNGDSSVAGVAGDESGAAGRY